MNSTNIFSFCSDETNVSDSILRISDNYLTHVPIFCRKDDKLITYAHEYLYLIKIIYNNTNTIIIQFDKNITI